jgi:hypothetical protein
MKKEKFFTQNILDEYDLLKLVMPHYEAIEEAIKQSSRF